MKPIYYLLILLVLASCSSVEKTMNKIKANPELSKAVVKYVIDDLKSCINDTVVVSKDSIVYLTKDSIVRDTITAGKCPDFIQILPSGIKVSSTNGVLKVEVPVKNTEKTVLRIVTKTVRDKKLEDILRTERDTATDKYVKELSAKEKAIKEKVVLEKEIKALKRKNTFTWIGIGIGILAVVFFKIKKYIPFI